MRDVKRTLFHERTRQLPAASVTLPNPRVQCFHWPSPHPSPVFDGQTETMGSRGKPMVTVASPEIR